MTPASRTTPAGVELPSTRTLALATVIALAIAATVLVTVVLPAEYRIDPLGTGRALGLDVMTAPPPQVEPERTGDGAVRLVPTQDGPVADYPASFRVDSRQLVLGPSEYVEFKYHLEKDATMVFSWRASGDVIQEFHGDRDGATADEPQTYDNVLRQQHDGSFAAPFTGIHGWYWENPSRTPITIELSTAGFYAAAHEFRKDRARARHDVGGPDRIVAAPPAEGAIR
jgi:hypothetical protein